MSGDPSIEGVINLADVYVPLALVAIFSVLVVFAAVSDLRRYLIPNWIPVALALLWCPWAMVAKVDPVASLLVGVGVFAAGTVLFAFRAFGGGDVKLLAAVSLWAGFPEVLTLIFQIAVAGGVLSLFWMLSGRARMALAYYGVPVPTETSTQVPYGVAIAIGGLLMSTRLAGL